MAPRRKNPRKKALGIIRRFFSDGGSLKSIISEALESSPLNDLDRRFIFNLAKGTVRYYLKSDYLISQLSGRDIKKIDLPILNILRMGVYQCYFMNSVPAYSAVDESVKLARMENRAASGFVNAVMRRITELKDPYRYIEDNMKRQGAGREDLISVLYSYPVWRVKYWTDHFGNETAVKLCRQLNMVPSFYIWANRERYRKMHPDKPGSYDDIFKVLGNIKAGRVAEDRDAVGDKEGLVPGNGRLFKEAARLDSAMGLEEEPLYKDGIITVQDLSSQMAVKYFLEPSKGEKILDCCAAPGGKASFASLIMENKGHITAVDKSSEKTGLLQSNLNRLGMSHIEVRQADAASEGFLDGITEGYFDRVMVDAPCTALGTISKDPEVKYNRSIDDCRRLSELSVHIMKACHPYLKTGGRMMFYTCTLSPVENQQAVRKFLDMMDGKYRIASVNSKDMELEIMPYWMDSQGGYVCVLEKIR